MTDNPLFRTTWGKKKPSGYQKNPERHINMLESAFAKFQGMGDFLYPEQRAIYDNLGDMLRGMSVSDFGCGIGIGTNIIRQYDIDIKGSDVEEHNVKCARCLFPDIEFTVFDIKKEVLDPRVQIAIAIEVIEHIDDVEAAIENIVASAIERVYISSPNRNNPELGQSKPINDFHVKEYTTHEMLEMLDRDWARLPGDGVQILDPHSFDELTPDTEITPVVYQIFL